MHKDELENLIRAFDDARLLIEALDPAGQLWRLTKRC